MGNLPLCGSVDLRIRVSFEAAKIHWVKLVILWFLRVGLEAGLGSGHQALVYGIK